MHYPEREPLPIGKNLELVHIVSANKDVFKITEIVGQGASCLVYSAEDVNNNYNRVRIKEYYPINSTIKRDKNDNLIIADSYSFEKGITRFIDAYERQISLRTVNTMTNSISNIQGVYSQNNTIYTVMTYNFGSSYDKIKDLNLNSMLKITRSVAKAIREYHRLGLLHLDIKPSNIYVMPETEESVILFDFDSIISKEDLHSGKTPLYSYSKDWASPEQLTHKVSLISEKSDIYSIGALVFTRIFNRPVSFIERMKNARYEIDNNSKLFENTVPEITTLLTDFLHKTLSLNPADRYDSIDNVIHSLDKLIQASDNGTPYIIQNSFTTTPNFIGREEEIHTIQENLERYNLLFISGCNGLGKSELAIQYANKHKSSYDLVIFVCFNNSLKETFASDNNIKIANFIKADSESENQYTNRKLIKIKELCNQRTLLIIDGFDTDNDDFLNETLLLNCKKIFTTSIDYSAKFPQLNITPLDFTHICSLFKLNGVAVTTIKETNYLQQLYTTFEGNTLIMVFILKQIKENYSNIENILYLIVQNRLSETLYAKSTELISNCFKLNSLSKVELYILQLLSEAPDMGIQANILRESTGLSDYQVLFSLERKGFIKYNYDSQRFTMHSLLKKITNNIFNVNTENKTIYTGAFYDLGMILSNTTPTQIIPILQKSFIPQCASNQRILIFDGNNTQQMLTHTQKVASPLDSDEYPIWFYDNSILIDANEGLLFTNKRIHIKALLQRKNCIPYVEIDKIYTYEHRAMFVLKNSIKITALMEAVETQNFVCNLINTFINEVTTSFTEKISSNTPLYQTEGKSVYKIKPFVGTSHIPSEKIKELTEHLLTRIEKEVTPVQSNPFSQQAHIYTQGMNRFEKIAPHYFPLDSDEIPIVLVDESTSNSFVKGFLLTSKKIHMYPQKRGSIKYSDIDAIANKRMPILKYYYVQIISKHNTELNILLSTYKESNSLYVFEVLVMLFEYINKLLS